MNKPKIVKLELPKRKGALADWDAIAELLKATAEGEAVHLPDYPPNRRFSLQQAMSTRGIWPVSVHVRDGEVYVCKRAAK